jgi:hypothetical protein
MNKMLVLIFIISLVSVSFSKNLTGNYAITGNNGNECGINILEWGNNLIEFEISCSRGAPSFNQGFLHDTVKIINNKATYRNSEYSDNKDTCIITLSFQGTKCIVEQNGSSGSCGFGGNVYCTGTYLKMNNKLPEFRNIAGENIGFIKKTDSLKSKIKKANKRV